MGDCPFWDAVEYMGMLCLSGETEYCDQVKLSQDETGRWWRSPGFRFNPDPNEKGPTFSRDMDRGVWAYIIATGDRESAARYMNFIRGNRYHLCPKSAQDWDACSTRATYWTLASQIFSWLDLDRDKRKMKAHKFLLERLYWPLEAAVVPPHYEMILTAEHIYLLQQLERRGGEVKNKDIVRKVARIIYDRVPGVPFYEYLVYGPNESSAQKILRLCPSTRPNVPVDSNGTPQYTEPGNGPWEQGSGHYCIFMINAVLGSAN